VKQKIEGSLQVDEDTAALIMDLPFGESLPG
jgi:hypothetical protein